MIFIFQNFGHDYMVSWHRMGSITLSPRNSMFLLIMEWEACQHYQVSVYFLSLDCFLLEQKMVIWEFVVKYALLFSFWKMVIHLCIWWIMNQQLRIPPLRVLISSLHSFTSWNLIYFFTVVWVKSYMIHRLNFMIHIKSSQINSLAIAKVLKIMFV